MVPCDHAAGNKITISTYPLKAPTYQTQNSNCEKALKVEDNKFILANAYFTMGSPSSSYSLEMFPGVEKEAHIHFKLLNKSFVVLTIMSSEHVEVRLLINEVLAPGEQSILFSYGNLQPANYRIRLMVNNDATIDIENLNFKIS